MFTQNNNNNNNDNQLVFGGYQNPFYNPSQLSQSSFLSNNLNSNVPSFSQLPTQQTCTQNVPFSQQSSIDFNPMTDQRQFIQQSQVNQFMPNSQDCYSKKIRMFYQKPVEETIEKNLTSLPNIVQDELFKDICENNQNIEQRIKAQTQTLKEMKYNLSFTSHNFGNQIKTIQELKTNYNDFFQKIKPIMEELETNLFIQFEENLENSTNTISYADSIKEADELINIATECENIMYNSNLFIAVNRIIEIKSAIIEYKKLLDEEMKEIKMKIKFYHNNIEKTKTIRKELENKIDNIYFKLNHIKNTINKMKDINELERKKEELDTTSVGKMEKKIEEPECEEEKAKRKFIRNKKKMNKKKIINQKMMKLYYNSLNY